MNELTRLQTRFVARNIFAIIWHGAIYFLIIWAFEYLQGLGSDEPLSRDIRWLVFAVSTFNLGKSWNQSHHEYNEGKNKLSND
jgi:hypothetical protein